MSKKYLFSSAIILTLVMSIFFPSKSQADWTNSFVVWDGYVYVLTDEVVDEDM